MPLYEFKCAECEKIAEFTLKMSDPHPTECPACGKPALSKIISQTAFVLKGGGWYADAYSSKKSAGNGASASGGGEASGGGSGESTAAPKAGGDASAAAPASAAPTKKDA